ncbi:hypothetical protein K8I28_11645, partial [bacterium]|nr:hypothetical protein [bacterium]
MRKEWGAIGVCFLSFALIFNLIAAVPVGNNQKLTIPEDVQIDQSPQNIPENNMELDEVLWVEDFEGDINWEFVDGNADVDVFWQHSDFEALEGNNWRCFDPNIGPDGGYN